MPPAGTPTDPSDDEERRRALERIVFAKGDSAEIERAARELEALRRALRQAQGPTSTVAEPEPGPTPAGSEAPPSDVPVARVASGAPDTGPSQPKPVLLATLALGILAAGILIGTVISSSGLADQTPMAAVATPVGGEPLPSPAAGAGTAFIDINTGQVVGYGGTEPAPALEIFDREQTDADMPAFPLAADLQPSTTRLLEMAGSASIFAAMDTLARPCLVVVGENQYSATCQTDFEFPKAGIRLSWAPSVAQAITLSESGRRSPVVYTAVWLPNGMVEVGALVQGR